MDERRAQAEAELKSNSHALQVTGVNASLTLPGMDKQSLEGSVGLSPLTHFGIFFMMIALQHNTFCSRKIK